jgi:hypothetical protein
LCGGAATVERKKATNKHKEKHITDQNKPSATDDIMQQSSREFVKERARERQIVCGVAFLQSVRPRDGGAACSRSVVFLFEFFIRGVFFSQRCC